MKVQIIGTGSMWTKYNSACYLIDKDIMVDFPNGTCKYLYRQNIEPRTINYVLLTHFHGDHYFDMPFYILNKSKSRLILNNSSNTASSTSKVSHLLFLQLGSFIYLGLLFCCE